ncbi:MAG: ribosome biogenesis GTP-binding protein YihA/YsxC [Bacilli bacterium]|nr:ribosome biogenesis GTP-binding protein YihA/YsxC [Bacilli bacterium]
MKADFRKTDFVTSCTRVADHPKDGLPAVLLLGRTNVGKSTMINALTGKKLAFSSKKAGKTKLLNYFLVDSKFYLVDTPGYGSTSYATMNTIFFAGMVEEYAKEKSLKSIVLLLDLRREPGEDDKKFIRYLSGLGIPLITVLTKVDQMNQSALHKAKTMVTSLGVGDVLLSDLREASLQKIRSAIVTSVA